MPQKLLREFPVSIIVMHPGHKGRETVSAVDNEYSSVQIRPPHDDGRNEVAIQETTHKICYCFCAPTRRFALEIRLAQEFEIRSLKILNLELVRQPPVLRLVALSCLKILSTNKRVKIN